MSSERVDLTIDDAGLARLRLSWAERRNAIDPAMVDALDAAVARCEAEPVRALLISAEGDTFTVGGDLAHFTAHADDMAGALEAMVPAFHDTLARLAELEAPVVCAVRGAIAGGGLGLAWGSDFVLAGESARFATGFARIALTGDGGSSWWLPRLIGFRRAQEMLLAGRVLDAGEALEWGLVTRVIADADLDREAEELAGRLAAGPTLAYARMRRLLREAAGSSLREGLAAETEAMLASGTTADAREGVTSFVERRAPRFEGR